MSSASPSTPLVSTGTPCAMASTSASPNPSAREGMTNRSNAPEQRAASSRKPVNTICHRESIRLALRSRRARSGPSPTSTQAQRSPGGIASAAASRVGRRRSYPFCGTSRPTAPTTRAQSSTPHPRRRAVRSAGERGSGRWTPLWITRTLSSGSPNRFSRCRALAAETAVQSAQRSRVARSSQACQNRCLRRSEEWTVFTTGAAWRYTRVSRLA